MVSFATRFFMVMTLIIIAQISLAFPAGRLSGRSRPLMASSGPVTKARSVNRTSIEFSSCIDNCRANLRECYRPSANSPRLRDQCVKRFTSCQKKCESAPPSTTQPQPKPGSVDESSSLILCKS